MANLIAMFICGIVFGISVLMIVLLHIFGDDYFVPTEDELDEMCEWYEAEYGKENNNG